MDGVGNIVHLLVIEDDANDVIFLKRAFDRLGIACQVSFAIDGDEAIDFLSSALTSKSREPDPAPTHVLLDLKLPRRSGLEVLKWIRGHPRLSGLPVVVFTSSQQASDVETASKLGIDSFQVKPVTFGDHLKIVEDIARSWGLDSSRDR
jgi:CheY-like chemotaxis protein